MAIPVSTSGAMEVNEAISSLCKYAKTNNVPVIINPDAHSVRGLADVAYGVMAARKGWLESDDVLNSLSADDMTKRLS